MTNRFLGLAAGAALLLSCGGGESALPQVRAKGTSLDVTVYATEKDRRTAVLRFGPLDDRHGYLLRWPRPRFMKLEPAELVHLNYDVLFLDPGGQVVDAGPLPASNEEGLMPDAEAAMALVLAEGSIRKLGLKKGDRVDLNKAALDVVPEDLPALKIGDVLARVELALDAPERSHGLMFRPRLSESDGMLFAYPDEGSRNFWMKNTLIPLDIAFFREDGTLVNVNETPMADDPRHGTPPTSPSAGPARFVLEMNRGWFKKKGLTDAEGHVKSGTRAVIPPQAIAESR
jgi:uncharacterized membrane protein (UPF0127 family)